MSFRNIYNTLHTIFRKHLFQRSSVFGRFRRLSESVDGRYESDERDEDSMEPHILSEEEIMHKYWKISVRDISFT